MADTASHTGISAAITIWMAESFESFGRIWIGLSIIVVNLLAHFLIDAIPHGHFRNKLIEVEVGFLFVGPFLIRALWGKSLGLIGLVLIGIFFGNIFDFLLVVAEGKKDGWSKAISNFNLWIHWFVRNYTFLDQWGLIKKYETSEEEWNGHPVYSLKFGWYNFIPIVLAIISLIF